MRPLMMDFPADRNGWNRADQYMFGNSLLVAPVLEAQYTPEKVMSIDENSGWNRTENATDSIPATVDFTAQRSAEVYLPAGSDWRDFFTGERHKGGRTIMVPVTLKSVPIYVKAGSILPIGPDVQYATEKPWDNLEIRVYPGADGEFTLYEDEFDNYNYEKGAYSTITFKWDDSSRTLSVGDRKGTFPGMLDGRKFRVRIMDGKNTPVKESTYDGAGIAVRL